jgi:hypothetical protein
MCIEQVRNGAENSIQAFIGAGCYTTVYVSPQTHVLVNPKQAAVTYALHGWQVVVISDPELTAQALDRSKYPELIDKPSEPMFYKVVDEVSIYSMSGFVSWKQQINGCIELRQLRSSASGMHLQTTASPPQESHLSAATSDPLWRAVRKGTAPAFSPHNMRCASRSKLSAPLDELAYS